MIFNGVNRIVGFCHHNALGPTLWTPTLLQVRHRTKPSLKEPTKFFKKLRFLKAAEPIYPEKPNVCGKLFIKERTGIHSIKDNRYALFLARCMREDFYKHPMIAIFHLNSFSGHDFLNARGLLYDNKFDMKLNQFHENRGIALEALTGTKFEPVLDLMVSRTALGFCSDPNVPKLLHCLKKMPQYILIGLVMENRLLHRADVERIATLPDITSLHAQLCHTLQSSSVLLSQTLTANQSALSSSLSTLVNQASDSATSTDEEDKSSEASS